MAIKLCRILMHGEAKPLMKSNISDHVITKSHVANWKLNISSSTRPIPPDLAGWWRWCQEATHGVTWLFDYAISWGDMENLKRNISSSTNSMVHELGRWRDSIHKTKWVNDWIRWSYDKLKTQNWKMLR